MWKIEVIFTGDEPDEDEVEKTEEEVQNALDAAGVDYADIKAG